MSSEIERNLNKKGNALFTTKSRTCDLTVWNRMFLERSKAYSNHYVRYPGACFNFEIETGNPR